jgi:hypothetical protein
LPHLGDPPKGGVIPVPLDQCEHALALLRSAGIIILAQEPETSGAIVLDEPPEFGVG